MCGGWRPAARGGLDAGVGAPHGLQPGRPGLLPPELSETGSVVPAPSAGAQRCFPGERQAVAQAPPCHGRTDLACRGAAGWLWGRKNLPMLISGAVLPKELGLLGLGSEAFMPGGDWENQSGQRQPAGGWCGLGTQSSSFAEPLSSRGGHGPVPGCTPGRHQGGRSRGCGNWDTRPPAPPSPAPADK